MKGLLMLSIMDMFILVSKMCLLVLLLRGGNNDEYWLDYEIAAASCRLGRAYRRITDWNVVRPTGGSYDNPHPVEDEWSAEPTSANGILWYSERLFTEDGRNQDAEWSMPAQLTYTLYTEFYTSNVEKEPGTPDTHPQNWVKGYQEGYIWLATQEVYNGSKQGWVVTLLRGTKIESVEATVDAEVGTPTVDNNNYNENTEIQFMGDSEIKAAYICIITEILG